LDAVTKILTKKSYINIVVNEYLNSFELSDDDKRFFTKIVYGTIDHLITIDKYLEGFCKKRPSAWILNLLRVSVYQLHWLNVPDYAVIDEAVTIAKIKDIKQANFVNAVWRNFLRTLRPDFS
jgi:16S rRNA (cytosine967-C5)-methyltransferase